MSLNRSMAQRAMESLDTLNHVLQKEALAAIDSVESAIAVTEEMDKAGFVPTADLGKMAQGGGMPPDPSMMQPGGMPPDPSMMQQGGGPPGAPPGAMPPAGPTPGMPPMPPGGPVAPGEGAPAAPPAGDPSQQMIAVSLQDLLTLFQQVAQGMGAQAPNEPEGGGQGGTRLEAIEQKLDELISLIGTIVGAPPSQGAPAGAAGAALPPEAGMPAIPPALGAEGMAAPPQEAATAGPQLSVAASVDSGEVKQAGAYKISQLAAVLRRPR